MEQSSKAVIYLCPRLSQNVRLTLIYLHHDSEFKAVSKIECESDRQCDIGSSDGHGGYSWNRELCPAPNHFKGNK